MVNPKLGIHSRHMKFQQFLIHTVLITGIFFCGNVFARMYQWVEPGSNSTQLSGKPPAWYRSANGGPRVFVFENGRLIDDTGVRVSDDVRQLMRQQAFIMAEDNKQQAQEKLTKANELKSKYVQEEPEEATREIEDINALPEETEILDKTEEDKTDKKIKEEEKKLEELRELITEWEKAQTEKAKETLQ